MTEAREQEHTTIMTEAREQEHTTITTIHYYITTEMRKEKNCSYDPGK